MKPCYLLPLALLALPALAQPRTSQRLAPPRPVPVPAPAARQPTRPATAAKPHLNRRLQRTLDSLERAYRQYEQRASAAFEQDQADSLLTPMRTATGALLGYARTGPSQAVAELPPDSTDLRVVAALIRRYGYPGKSLVGKPASEIAWRVLQRTDQTTRFLPQLRTAAEAGELAYEHYAIDHQLMQAGQPQRYGTQVLTCLIPDQATGQLNAVSFVWPVADLRRADALRRQHGFPTTIAQEARQMGVSAQPVSLEYARRMKHAAESGGE